MARGRGGSRVDERVRIGAAAAALGVSADTLRRWERAGRVEFERGAGGQRLLASSELARLLRERAGGTARQSARNRFDGVVVAVARDGVMAQVELVCGPFRVVSLMSREAADELGLAPGVAASAIVKATNVIVERRSS